MKISKGIPILTVLVLILIFALSYYLLNFFQGFSLSEFRGLSIAFLVVTAVLTSFAAGSFIIFLFLQPWVLIGEFILSLSLVSTFLILLTLITAKGADFFKVTTLVILPLFVFHIFVLGFFLYRFLRRHTSFQPKRIITAAEKRGATRIKDSMGAQVLDDNGWFDAKVVDVSGTGVRLLLTHVLAKGKELEVKLFLPFDNRTVYVMAKVMWVREMYPENNIFHAGMMFTKIDPADRLRLTFTNLFQRRIV